jgi:hypothetical protein
MKKIRFNKELLNYGLRRDEAKINEKVFSDSTNFILNRETRIKFICKCGEEGEKKFRTAIMFGGFYCVNCTNFNRVKKIKNINSQKNNNKKILQEMIEKENIKIHSITINKVINGRRALRSDQRSETVKEEEIKIENNNIKSIKKIIKSDIIKGECKECKLLFEKSLKYLIKNGPICYKCCKNIGNDSDTGNVPDTDIN